MVGNTWAITKFLILKTCLKIGLTYIFRMYNFESIQCLFFKLWWFITKAVNIETKSYRSNATKIVFLYEAESFNMFLLFLRMKKTDQLVSCIIHGRNILLQSWNIEGWSHRLLQFPPLFPLMSASPNWFRGCPNMSSTGLANPNKF